MRKAKKKNIPLDLSEGAEIWSRIFRYQNRDLDVLNKMCAII